MNVKVKLTRLLFSILVLSFFAMPGRSPAQAGTPVGTIAYVRPNGPNGDVIRLVEPDGSGDRLLFSTNHQLPENLSDILSLAWKPDASELAFSSAHEYTCSQYETDVYAIHADGSGYRRITGEPACGQRGGIPTGTVTVPVINYTGNSGPFIIYFEGAPGAKSIVVPPGDAMNVTFTNVADYGSKTQAAVWMFYDLRSPYPGANVDVIPGATVMTGPLQIYNGFSDWGFQTPSYLPDGSKVATIFSRYRLYEFDPNSQVLGWNADLIPFDFGLWGAALTWSPTPEFADSFLYFGGIQDNQYVLREYVYLGNATDGVGQEIFDVDPNEDGNYLLGLAWLPDGSGFLYSLKQSYMDWDKIIWYDIANLWEYSFATGQSTQLTEVPNHTYTRDMSVSPDGSTILFEYQASGDWIDANPPIDLYMMNRDGSGASLFIEDARTPVWSLQDIPADNPAPLLTGINPVKADAGGAGFTLTASGSSFLNNSVVRWNGTALPTTYVNATSLTAQVPADKIAAAGTASVTVYTPGPGGGVSAPKSFTINSAVVNNPLPVVTSISPNTRTSGQGGFLLTVNGSGYVSASAVRWNGTALPTTFINSTKLTAQVPADKTAAAGSALVTVFSPTPGGGLSQPQALIITSSVLNQKIFLPAVRK